MEIGSTEVREAFRSNEKVNFEIFATHLSQYVLKIDISIKKE
jgi:hypothetical protein